MEYMSNFKKGDKNMNLSKISVTQNTHNQLKIMTQEVNKNFNQGDIKKPQLLYWIINNFHKKYFIKSIPQIQKENIDSVYQLEALLKKAKLAKKEGLNLNLKANLAKL